ncbi:MAG: tripartite tricarboxylate transporter TctB family protein [Methyloligellaceae bacterium]
MSPLEVKADERAGASAEDQALAAQPSSRVDVDIETPTLRGDVVAALLCLGSGLIGYFVLVPAAVYVPSSFAGTVNSPAFFPNVMFLILSGLSGFYLVRSLVAYRHRTGDQRTLLHEWVLASGTALICVGYVAAIYTFGMTAASAACLAATIYYFGERRLWIIVPTSLVLPALLWLFFVKAANVLFPIPVVPVIEFFLSAASSGAAAEWAMAPATAVG